MVLVVNGKVSMTEKTVSYKTLACLYCLPIFLDHKTEGLLVWQRMFFFMYLSPILFWSWLYDFGFRDG